jgi:hypothetical protein
LTLSAVPSLAQAGSLARRDFKTKNPKSELAMERREDGLEQRNDGVEQSTEPSLGPRIIGYKDGGGGEGVAPGGGSANYARYTNGPRIP